MLGRETRPVLLLALAALATGGYSWWVTSLRPFTSGALAGTLVGVLAAVALGSWLTPVAVRSPIPVEPASGRVGWLVLLGAVVVWELAAFVQLPRSDHPTLSSLANEVLSVHGLRALGMVAWLVLGARIARP